MRFLVFLACGLTLLAAPPKKKEPQQILRVPVQVDAGRLDPSTLKARILGGSELEIRRIRGPGDGLLLLIVLDLTGDITLAELAKGALVSRLAALPADSRAAILRAQDGLRVLQDPSRDAALLETAVRGSASTGKAELLTTIETAARLADSVGAKSAVRAPLLYISDSSVQNYREDFTNPVINSSDSRDLSRRFPEGLVREKVSKVQEALAKFQTPVWIVHLDYRTDRLNEAYQMGLIQLAASSGGEALFCRSLTDIPGAINGAIDRMINQYQVSVLLPKGTPRRLSLELTSGDRRLSHRERFLLP